MERCREVRRFFVLERRADIRSVRSLFHTQKITKITKMLNSRFALEHRLWGLAYLAAQENSPIFLVFAIEKAFYVVRWIQWMSRNDGMKEIKKAFRSKDKLKILAPLFHSTYGTGDFLFGVLFLFKWLRVI